MAARTALEMATLGGAAVLGRDDIGALEAGRCADFFTLDLSRLEFAGGLHDPVAAALLCSPVAALHTYVGGRAVVSGGECTCLLHEQHWVDEHNRAAQRLVSGD
jgi:cytosine/adenosine deaminase-related metal-dependent hydrolase